MTIDLSRGTAANDLLAGIGGIDVPTTEAHVTGIEELDWENVWEEAKARLYKLTHERGTDLDGTALMALWADGALAMYRSLRLVEKGGLHEAARRLIAEGVMSSGSGQSPAPTFDKSDRATAPQRWYVVNAEHFDELKVVMAKLAVGS